MKEKSLLLKVILAVGLLPALFFLVFLFGEALGELIDGKTAVIPFLIFILIPVSGYLISWFKAKAGALCMITGSMVLGGYLLFLSGFSSFSVFLFYSLPFLLPGSILLILLPLKKV